jgi:8-oxo-dGTP pyrophosphatase MutT (NUDIX family)
MQTENPFITQQSTQIYENAWIRVDEHQIINPAGNPGIYGTIHFKNKALAIIPIDQNGDTWIVGQYRYPLGKYCWEIPMGGGLVDLDLLESAKRELKEETGLSATKWTEIMLIHPSNSVTDEEGIIYLAEDLIEGETEFEETEVLEVRKLPFAEVLEMVMKGEITDGISVAGILKAARILGY